MTTMILRLSLTVGLLLGGCCLMVRCDSRSKPDLTFSPAKLPPATLGETYEVILTISDNATPVGDVFIESGELPPGLTLTFLDSTDTAEIHGIPEKAGSFEFVVGAWCFGTNVSGDTGEHAYTLEVK